MSGVSILITTIDDEDKAKALARAVLAERLAACVQIAAIASHYVWKGEYCETREWRLEMKCRGADYPALAALVRRLHSYETPEILRIDAADADLAYAAWLNGETRRD
ncbi:divalent-cation tolerance protein CutA [Methylocystis parvus]|uniref:Divalent-cation tolerance protein CutA n=1 Tax=Methylocystis parvus TaxID=134 RepID=A0A6B8M460_9HYPH|nr:divalent-cation tolerance protein CutA [Methylocystis parvus]QGM97691.1 divalent-cation tolerance protein CutA [Methylocystis parvus]WBJ98374.1 divalent-cation tolerance protein CutA [Methylocystis parvus OBBP]